MVSAQWFLTEVHYKFNSVERIRDLSMFWSITILDLSHNNIKAITGLETLRLLQRPFMRNFLEFDYTPTLISLLSLFAQVPPSLRLILQPHPTLRELEPSPTSLVGRFV